MIEVVGKGMWLEVSKKVRMLLVGFEVGLLCFEPAISMIINRIKTNIAISIKAPLTCCITRGILSFIIKNKAKKKKSPLN